jgi:hypothetical protein
MIPVACANVEVTEMLQTSHEIFHEVEHMRYLIIADDKFITLSQHLQYIYWHLENHRRPYQRIIFTKSPTRWIDIDLHTSFKVMITIAF